MKRLLFSFLLLLSAAWASAQTDINNVFVYMPDSLLPLLTRNDRLDLLDYHKAGMEARVTNLMGGTTTLLERNDTTICLQLTAVSRWRITIVTDTFGAVRYRITKTFFLPEEWQREEWYDPESEQDKHDPSKTLSEPPAWMANSIPAPRRAPQHPPYSRPLAD